MLTLTSQGLYCPAGGFHIDARGPVEHSIITHSHSDHARKGARLYTCVTSGAGLLKMRVGQKISVNTYNFGERFLVNGVTVSFHPAGHILGSCQIRLELDGEVWVVSGDYKRDPDPTCEPFEPVPCDVFVTEATFGTPAYQWKKDVDLGRDISNWWRTNADNGLNSVLFAYSLGKAQRVLGVLEPYAVPIYCHPSVTETNRHYEEQGIALAQATCVSQVKKTQRLNGALILAPQSFLKSPEARMIGDRYATAFASGWMARGHHGYEEGFVMSDHADWNDLVQTVLESQAKKVFVQHRGQGALVRHLRTLGLQAFPESALRPKDSDQLLFF